MSDLLNEHLSLVFNELEWPWLEPFSIVWQLIIFMNMFGVSILLRSSQGRECVYVF